MTGETIYDAITMISDRLIEETEAYPFRRKSKWRRFAALAAAFALVTGLGAGVVTGRIPIIGLGGASQAGGHGGGADGYSYMSYAGPVLPLTALSDAEGVTAARHIDLDFSPYEARTETHGGSAYTAWDSEAIVTDAYNLTNTTDEARALTLLYPVEGSFNSALDRLPVITVDGAAVETTLHAAPYSGGFGDAWGGNDPSARLNLDLLTDWQGYVDLLSDGRYQAAAFAPYPTLDVPVTVYRVDNYVVAPTDAANPSLQFSYHIDFARTTVMSYGANGGSNDFAAGVGNRMVGGLGHEYRPPEPMYVIFYGDDIDGYTLQGYANMGGDEGTEIDVTATVTRYETTMDAVLRQIVDEWLVVGGWYETIYGESERTVASVVPRETLCGAAAELLTSYGVFSDNPAGRYDMGMLEDVLEAYSMGRVMYSAFDVTIPAGGSVDVTAVMRKDNSYDYIGEKQKTDGYDLATRLGSTLTFTEQTASVSNTAEITVVENNFGFDLSKGITAVTLQNDTEHYWMQIARKP